MGQVLINSFVKGLITNVDYINQPEGSSPYILNAIDSEKLGSITNERGFLSNPTNLSINEIIIHTLVLDDSSILSFITNNPFFAVPISKILRTDKYGTAVVLIDNSDFNFNARFPIRKADFHKNSKDETIIIWTDFYNPIRWLNIDNVPNPLVIDETVVSGQELKIPVIELDSIQDSGGANPVGTYEFTIALEDQDGVRTDFIAFSNIITFNAKSISTSTNGYLDNTYNGDISGTATSKAIKLNISNLDTNYKYYILAVYKNIAGVTTQFIVAKEFISDSSTQYLYTGTEQTQDVDLEDLQVDTIKYKYANTLVIRNNRLMIGNLRTDPDVEYQQYANNIITGTVFRNIDSYRNDSIRYEGKTFPTDEVIPLGIILRYKDGTRSTPFHIPGRPINTAVFGGTIDTDETDTIYASDPDNFIGTDSSKWQIYNTGKGGPKGSFSGATTLCENGYWQSTELYPIGKDYPTTGYDTSHGLAPTGTSYIRHHKISDDCIPYNGNGKIAVSGFRIGNIVIPKNIRDLIDGFEIVRGIRNSNNRTIIAKGFAHWMAGLNYTSTPYKILIAAPVGNPNSASNKDALQFYSPDTQFVQPTITAGCYFKFRAEYVNTIGVFATAKYNIGIENLAPTGWDKSRNYKIKASEYIPHNVWIDSHLNTGRSWYNLTGTSHLAVIINRWLDSNGDDGTITNANDFYCYVKKYLPNQYGKLEDIEYVSTNLVVSNIQDSDFDGSDIYIPSKGTADTMNVTSGDSFVSFYGFLTRTGQGPYAGTSTNSYNSLYTCRVESGINVEFRMKGASGDSYYPLDTVSTLLGYSNIDDNINVYNPDYSRDTSLKVFIPNGDQSVFINDFKYRVAYSEKDLGESIGNPYRTFLANNYRDIPKNKGVIEDLFIFRDTLIAHTEKGIFDMKDTTQQMNTDIGAVYIGTGEIFSLNPTDLSDIKEGYAGIKDIKSKVISSEGLSFVDINSKNIFLTKGGFSNDSEISSNKGMLDFFNENIPLYFINDLYNINSGGVTLDTIYPYANKPEIPFGVGWISIYDKDKKRLIFTKKDIRIKSSLISIFNGIITDSTIVTPPTGLSIYFNSDKGWFILYNNDGFTISKGALNFYDNTYLENISFSISYSFVINGWRSFHSYTPTNYINNGENVFIYNNLHNTVSNLYKLNSGDFGNYFGTIYPFVVETVFNQYRGEDKYFNSIVVNSYFSTNNDTDKVGSPSTFFNNLWLYNEAQASNSISLYTSTAQKNVDKRARDYSINKFYNVLDDNSGVENIFNKSGIDKVFNTNAFASSTPWFRQTRFYGKYLVSRFILDNTDNIFATINHIGFDIDKFNS